MPPYVPFYASYVVDVALFVLLGVVDAIFFLTGAVFVPHHRVVIANDPSLQMPHDPDLWPTELLFVSSGVFPVLCFVACLLLRKRMSSDGVSWRAVLIEGGVAVLALLSAFIVSDLLTQFAKLYVGYPRPSFFNRPESRPEDEERKSFFSGHASSSFSTLTVAALFVAHSVGAFRSSSTDEGAQRTFGQVVLSSRLLRLLAALTPLVVAFLVALSRIRDYSHHRVDVATGAAVGAACGALGYYLYFQGVSAPLHRHLKTRAF